jgi:hypothetical protein
MNFRARLSAAGCGVSAAGARYRLKKHSQMFAFLNNVIHHDKMSHVLNFSIKTEMISWFIPMRPAARRGCSQAGIFSFRRL